MEFAYKPPRHLSHLDRSAARTEVGWGVEEDGTVGVQHIISSNPFAGKAKTWGIATISDDGDVSLISKGPGNARSEEQLPEELIQKVVQFYEKEGLNVRNISEVDPASEKTAEIDQGLALCPECHSSEVYVVPDGPMGHSEHFDCENCGYHGHQDELVDGDVDPDPDRNLRDTEPEPRTVEDYNDDWRDYMSKKEAAGEAFSLQGAVVTPGGGVPVEGIAINTKMSREQVDKLVGGLNETTPRHEQEQQFVDEMNKGEGTSFPRADAPWLNRGGSTIDDYFLETKEAAPTPIGIPGTGMGDPRNFDESNSPGFIIVAEYTTTDDMWLFASPKCRGVVARTGGSTSHAVVVARPLGIPVISEVADIAKITPGDHLRLDPTTGRIDVNGGDASFEVGDQMRARTEVLRFVWSQGHLAHSPVTQPLEDELAAMPFTHDGEPDRSHYAMIEWLDEQGQYDWEDGTIGIVYDDGTAEYYEPISDEGSLEQTLKSTFPTKVQQLVYKQTQGGIYGPAEVNAKTAELSEEAPQCPKCDSHSYDVINFPAVSGDNGELRCLNCGTDYTHPLILNPKDSATTGVGLPETRYPSDPESQAKVVDLLHQIAQASQQGNRAETIRLQAELEQLLGGNPAGSTQPIPATTASEEPPQWFVDKLQADLEEELLRESGMLKGAPYPENSDKNAPDHSPKGQNWPKKVNSIYNACMREGNGSGDTKEEKESSCAAIAWAQYKKMKKSSLENPEVGEQYTERWTSNISIGPDWVRVQESVDELLGKTEDPRSG
jgi:phosphohistidine swiveling domain-containing protein